MLAKSNILMFLKNKDRFEKYTTNLDFFRIWRT